MSKSVSPTLYLVILRVSYETHVSRRSIPEDALKFIKPQVVYDVLQVIGKLNLVTSNTQNYESCGTKVNDFGKTDSNFGN